MSKFMYFSLEPPKQWRAGFTGSGDNKKEFFFDCGRCGAKEPPIAGILAAEDNPTFTGIAILTDKSDPRNAFVRQAMYCADCFKLECDEARAK